MDRMVSVRLRDTGQNYVYNAHDLDVKENDYVIVEHDRGLDYGQVVSLKPEHPAPEKPGASEQLQASEDGQGCPGGQSPASTEGQGRPGGQPPGREDGQGRPGGQPPGREDGQGRPGGQPPAPVKRIIRVAKEADLKQIEDNRARCKEAFTTCQKKIAEHKLEMKLVQAEYSFDRSKIIFYFTSGGRVDFRNLVKDLAKIFKARIELRQIGVRDETKFFGGYGPCGRQLCCATFLKDFEPVTIKMAKEEGLPLNPPKISGICGRLMCCLNYEYETYKMLSRGLPREGERITTSEGKGKVINLNVFKRSATVELEDGKIIELSYKDKVDGVCENPACSGCPQYQQERPERDQRQQQRRDSGHQRPDRGQRPEQRGNERNDRQDRGRQDRGNNRGEQRDDRSWQGRPGQQGRGGQSPAQREAPGRPGGQPNRPQRDRQGQNQPNRSQNRLQQRPQDRQHNQGRHQQGQNQD